jgi:oxygen-independent coproporphyrinogen-3 oxidase
MSNSKAEPYGLYFHIPFCLRKCSYCDYYSLIKLDKIDEFVNSLTKEVESRKIEENHLVKTIYIGGGTPSLLSYEHFSKIFEVINQNYKIDPEAEVSVELNPENVSEEYIKQISKFVNRYSLGVQSFDDLSLLFLGRVHNADMAKKAVEIIQNQASENINIDLIYGLPSTSRDVWKANLDKFFQLNIPHLSAYSLSIEEKTKLWADIRHKKIPPLKEENSLEDYNLLIEMMKERNYHHYEISNFAKDGFFSQHNSSYWKGRKYLGFGPSAHSYDGNIRRWNLSSITLYMKAIENNTCYFDYENLSERDKLNEYIMTSLRTFWGINLQEVKGKWGEYLARKLLVNLNKISPENIINIEQNWTLTQQGMMISDDIISDLFFID